MVAERLLKDDPYDGANQSWEDLEFDMNNVLTYSSLSGGRKKESEAATTVKCLLDEVRTMNPPTAREMVQQQPEDKQVAFTEACELLYATLALCTTERAKLIVKETMNTRNGAEAWTRLQERYSKTTGATSYAEIFTYNWTSSE